MMALLQARTQAKQLARSTNQTTVQAHRKQPAEIFADPGGCNAAFCSVRRREAISTHQRAFAQGFGDLKSHQLKTYIGDAARRSQSSSPASIRP